MRQFFKLTIRKFFFKKVRKCLISKKNKAIISLSHNANQNTGQVFISKQNKTTQKEKE